MDSAQACGECFLGPQSTLNTNSSIIWILFQNVYNHVWPKPECTQMHSLNRSKKQTSYDIHSSGVSSDLNSEGLNEVEWEVFWRPKCAQNPAATNPAKGFERVLSCCIMRNLIILINLQKHSLVQSCNILHCIIMNNLIYIYKDESEKPINIYVVEHLKEMLGRMFMLLYSI